MLLLKKNHVLFFKIKGESDMKKRERKPYSFLQCI
jgi:hypothetical protein